MHENKAKAINNRSLRAEWLIQWNLWLPVFTTLVLGFIAWRLLLHINLSPGGGSWREMRWWALPLSASLHALIAIGTIWSLKYAPISRKWRYRAGLLTGGGWGVLLWALQWLIPQDHLPLAVPTAAVGGALLGAFMATASRGSIFENNMPPAANILAEVHARHRELIGLPERGSLPKRAFDLCLACIGMVLSSPVWMFILLLTWLEDPGPLIFIKNSVGKGGKNFHQYKFRTMVFDAERQTGPVVAREEDERILRVGRFLRKTALDELPQLINILRGEMSFVGPRPQRTVLVHRYLENLPEFAERHKVLPGLAGLAQVAGDYYLSPLQKLRYDRLYARHASLGFDLKLLALAFVLVFWLRWRKDGDDRVPRAWFRWGT